MMGSKVQMNEDKVLMTLCLEIPVAVAGEGAGDSVLEEGEQGKAYGIGAKEAKRQVAHGLLDAANSSVALYAPGVRGWFLLSRFLS